MAGGGFVAAIYVFGLQGNPKHGDSLPDHLPFRTPVRSRFSMIYVFVGAAIIDKALK